MEVQLSDHQLTLADNQFEVYFAIKLGDVIVVGKNDPFAMKAFMQLIVIIFLASHKVNVTREALTLTDRLVMERGNIVVDVNQTEPLDTIYNAQ